MITVQWFYSANFADTPTRIKMPTLRCSRETARHAAINYAKDRFFTKPKGEEQMEFAKKMSLTVHYVRICGSIEYFVLTGMDIWGVG